ncbi:hypothetical protein F4778DRAFT_785842 [Xylariomycetidae sp. FL2044]|nr:hypothetical protein F4778DRAFT_785842 [Xylariomycetidae sp. FL2044]
MASRIPPLLEPYLRLPPETSLLLLSGVLGSTANWLLHRCLYSLLADTPTATTTPDASVADLADTCHVRVVLVSFLRDYAFWRDGLGRLGLDLDAAAKRGRFVFLDALTGLFYAAPSHRAYRSTGDQPWHRTLPAATLSALRKELEDAVAQTKYTIPASKTVLIMDQPDLLLAASAGEISSLTLRDTLLDMREQVHSSIITVSADDPLVSSQSTTLEKEHAAFALTLAHDARLVMSLRMLDTGTARDVSGVLRITTGPEAGEVDLRQEDRELLYFVAGDGGVRVFERGQ